MVATLKPHTVLHPLAAAAERGHMAAVSCLLLALGAPPNHDGSVVDGLAQHTPLMLAALKAAAVSAGWVASPAAAMLLSAAYWILPSALFTPLMAAVTRAWSLS